MSRRRARGLVALVCSTLAMTGLTGLAGGTPATAEGHSQSTDLQLHGFTDIVADTTHGQEFVSGGRGDDAVVVVDQDGTVVRKLGGLPGASGLALSPDRGTVYVALAEAHAIAAIDTTTYVTRLLPVPSDTCPLELAVAAGLVWYHQDCSDEAPANGTVDAIDPSTGTVHRDLAEGGSVSDVLATPARPNTLVLARGGISVLHVTGGDDPAATVTGTSPVDSEKDLAMSADGDRLITFRGVVLDTDSLRQVDYLPASSDGHGFNESVAMRDDGAVALDNNPTFGASLLLYPPGQTVWPHQDALFLDDQGPVNNLPPHGLAFGASRLYAVADDKPDDERLFVIDEDLTPHVPTGTHQIPLLTFDQMVADPDSGRAFVSGGIFDNGVAVLDSKARVTRVLQHLAGPAGIVRPPTGHSVYVALYAERAIAAIDTHTLHVRKFSTGPGACPESVVAAAGLIWFETTDCVSSPSNYLGALDPATGQVHTHLFRLNGDTTMVADQTHPHQIYLDTYPGRLAVEGGPHPSVRARAGLTLPNRTTDAVMSPDGMNLLASSGGDTRTAQSADDLAVDGLAVFPSPTTALAVRADGLTATGLYEGEPYGVLVSPRPQGATALEVRQPSGLLPHGLAFGRRDLYVATGNASPAISVRLVTMPPVRLVNISRDSTVHVSGDTVTVAAHVTGAGSTRRTVSIYALRQGAPHRILIRRGRPDAFGNLRGHLRVATTTRFSAVVGGHPTSTSSVDVSPGLRFHDRIDDATGKTTDTHDMPMGSRPRLSTQVSPAHSGQCVWFHVDGKDPWQSPDTAMSGCHRLDEHGRASYVVPAKMSAGRIDVRVEWRGDRRNQADTGPWHEIAFPCNRPGLTPPDCD